LVKSVESVKLVRGQIPVNHSPEPNG